MTVAQRGADPQWDAAVEGLAEVDPLGVTDLAVPDAFVTGDPGVARERVARSLAAHELIVLGEAEDFRAHAAVGHVGDVTVLDLGYGAPVRLRRPGLGDYAALVVPLTGTVEFGVSDRREVARPYRTMAVFGHGDPVDASWSAGARAFVIRVGSDELTLAWRRLMPEASDSSIRLSTGSATGAAGYAVYGALQLLARAWREYGPSDRLPATLARPLGEQILTALLLGIPHSGSALLRALTAPVPGHRVREAVARVLAEESAESTVLDLAMELGVGVRALELGFRRELGVTPSEFVRGTRLRRAHEELQTADPAETTVSAVAARWGFANHGRFASRYRERYGVLPGATLHGR